jgi:hypothetical protein
VSARAVPPADTRCPECGSLGPWKFVKYNAKGAIVECVALEADGWPCHRRVQVDF